jgi:hypothetical protein
MGLVWDSRDFESGIDRGVFFPQNGIGVPWNGLTSIAEDTEGFAQSSYYVDGQKQVNQVDLGSFSATVEAFTYPDEFLPYDGYSKPIFTGQVRPTFNLSYRTFVNETDYKLHLVYNCMVKPTVRDNATLNSSLDILAFSWNLTTTPVAFPYDRPTSHIFLDSRFVDPATLTIIEDILYGSDGLDPRFPSIVEFLGIFEANALITITDHGDGSFTADGPDANVKELNPGTQLVDNGDGTFTVDDTTITITDNIFTVNSSVIIDNGDGTFTVNDSTGQEANSWLFDWPNVVQITDDSYLVSSY